MDVTVATHASWYLLDADDRVIDVCPEWDVAALARGGGPGDLRLRVLGQPLARFIADVPTRALLAAQVQAARLTGRTRRLPYRADCPEMLRSMALRLVPQPQGAVRMEHQLLDSERLRGRFEVVAAPLGQAPRLWRCSLCLHLRQGGSDEWVDPARLPAGSVQVHYTVCPRCARWA